MICKTLLDCARTIQSADHRPGDEVALFIKTALKIQNADVASPCSPLYGRYRGNTTLRDCAISIRGGGVGKAESSSREGGGYKVILRQGWGCELEVKYVIQDERGGGGHFISSFKVLTVRLGATLLVIYYTHGASSLFLIYNK